MKIIVLYEIILYYLEEALHYPPIKPDFPKELDFGAGLG